MPLSIYFHDRKLKYTGEQLRSHFALDEFGIEGDSIVAFTGPCDISGDNLVDMEEAVAGERIYSPMMLHFITETFYADIRLSALLQLLITVIIMEQIEALKGGRLKGLARSGDDIYVDDKKLSISIATISPISCLIHHGLNIKKEGVEFPITCLEDIGVDAVELAQNVLQAVKDEFEDIDRAMRKVRWVR